MPKISVIVPVYNVEKYLARCIDSILNQTFTDFELILVDDGSPDNSGLICDEYERKDDRVKVIHKVNSGVSSARNTGIDKAIGEYITFVDSDDYIDNEMLEKMIKETSVSPDMVISSIKMICKNGEYIYRMKNNIYSSRELIDDFCLEKFSRICLCGPWCKLYSLDKIKKNNIRFDVSLNVGEDTYFNIQYVLQCTKIIAISDICYYYMRDNENSLFTKFRDYYYENSVKVYKVIVNAANRLECSSEAIHRYTKDHVNGLICNIGKAIITADKDTCVNYLKKISIDSDLISGLHMLKNNRRNYLLAKLVLKKHFQIVYYMGKIWFKFINKR